MTRSATGHEFWHATGSAMAGRCLLHGSAPSTAMPRYQQGSRGGPRIMRGQTVGPPVIFWGWRDGAPSRSSSKRCGEPRLRPPRLERSGHPDRVHDRGRCPLYVRAQLDTVGLSWTQRDLVRLKATAREAGKTQLTGYFRWWWQVLGSNQRRLSRRFYRPPWLKLVFTV
jgi:hypothetical protein